MQQRPGEDRIFKGIIMAAGAAAGAVLAFRAVRLVAAALVLGGMGMRKKQDSPPIEPGERR